MAAPNSVSATEGQSWNSWAETIGFRSPETDEEADTEAETAKRESDAMKLRKEDMELFGFCPAWDDFYLVVCEICNQVTKPQALRNHLEQRHGSIGNFARGDHTADPSVLHPSGGGKSSGHSSSSSSSSSSSTSSSSAPRHSGGQAGRPSSTAKAPTGSSLSGKHSGSAERLKRNHHTLAPVVRVERMPLPRQPDGTAARNSSPGREKELPSPQQPPPLTPGGQGLLSGPGPGQANHVMPGTSAGGAPALAVATTPTTAPTSVRKVASGGASTAGTGSSHGKKIQRERKLLPCKDREYDPNKHCGVLIGDSGKPCTRSLTCKTHSLTLRRAVAGRRKNFDELLSEHRATKEAALNASKSAHPPSSSASSVTDGVTSSPAPSPLSSHHTGGPSTNVAASSAGKHGCPSEALPGNRTSGGSVHLVARAPSGGGSKQSVLSKGSSGTAASSAGASAKQDQNSKSTPMDTTPAAQATSQPSTGNSSTSSGSTTRQRPDHSNDPYVSHHPRPAAVCTFGLRQMGNGLFLLDRRWDATRSALASALGTDGTQPPPLKRLCVVDSRLPNAAGSGYVSSKDEHLRSANQHSIGSVAVVEAPVAVATSQTSVPHTLATAVRSSSHPTGTSGGTLSTQAMSTAIAAAHPVSKATHPSKQAAPSRSAGSNGGGSSGGNVLLSSAPRKKKPVSSTVATVVTSSTPSLASSLATVSSIATSTPVSSVASAVQVPLSGTSVTFPFRTHLGALSRLQVSGQGVASKDGGTAMLVTTADVLNGQVSSGGLLHSVKISKPAVATTLLQCRPVDDKAAKPAAGPTLLKARKLNPPASGRTSSTPVMNNHHQPSISQGLVLPELLAAPQVPVPTASQLPNGMPTVLGQSKLFSVPNHSVQGVLDGTTFHQAQLVAKGARNGSRSHPGRAVLPDTASSVMTGSTATSLPASMAKQQLYQQVLAGQVQAQLVPTALKLPLLLPNDERRHRPQQPHLKVPGGSLPT
ncbi:uncharacterized protein LOC119174745 isoform X3 [Rhipicephalus microplus]|uniref:uncharacterized protein LOC119174745 isoform X3 n=1 Tax=Rhipicephalus microplus TaxID=6941 RepID=UPI003F6AD465